MQHLESLTGSEMKVIEAAVGNIGNIDASPILRQE